MAETCEAVGNVAKYSLSPFPSADTFELTTTRVAEPIGSLPLDFVPIHVSLACVLVIALLIGWDTRRSARRSGGLHRQS